MKLEEALKYRRKGYDIKRLGFSMSQAGTKHDYPLFTLNDIDADDWGVVRKKVSWNEAWEALQHGKVIVINDPNTAIKRIRLASKEEAQSDALECAVYCWDNSGGRGWGWSLYGTSIPMRWLSRTDFEVIEEAE